MNYDEACTEATTDQGLDQVIKALEDAGISPGLEQTGGFCMVVTVAHDNGTWAITNENHKVRDEPLVGWYPADSWTECVEAEFDFTAHSLAAMVALVKPPVLP